MEKTVEQQVKEYFDNNIDNLGDSRFHYLSRNYALSGESYYLDCIANNELYKCPKDKDSFIIAVKKIMNNNPVDYYAQMSVAAEIRRPYYERYKEMFLLCQILYVYFSSKNIWKVDFKSELLSIISEQEFKVIYQKILNSLEDMFIISTTAVNFAVLCNRLFNFEDGLEEKLIEFGNKKLEEKIKTLPLTIQLYFITHVIIADTEFYFNKNISTGKYVDILKYIESLVLSEYDNLSLDVKLEVLYCFKIVKLDTKLRERVYLEAIKSLSTKGTYIIDKYNLAKKVADQKDKISQAEHRNILFVMNYFY